MKRQMEFEASRQLPEPVKSDQGDGGHRQATSGPARLAAEVLTLAELGLQGSQATSLSAGSATTSPSPASPGAVLRDGACRLPSGWGES